MSVSTANQSLMYTGGIHFPAAISEAARQVDSLFFFIYALSAVVFFGIVFALIYFVIKFRRTEKHQIALNQMTHNTTLEVVWTVIPLILVTIIFVWGYTSYLSNVVPPENSKEIRVIARKWSWAFEDPVTGIRSSNDLVVPVGQPIRLVMSSEDVIHSLYIPNLRVKQDVLPNHYTSLAFTADKMGQFQIFCAEYCGDGHSKMMGNLKVLSATDYAKWQIDQKTQSSAAMPMDQLGKKIANDQGCMSCHTIDGSKSIGPSWKGIYGQSHAMVGGKSVKVDDNYIRRSATEPAGDIVAGYSPMMPTYKGKLSDHDLAAIIEFIKTLK